MNNLPILTDALQAKFLSAAEKANELTNAVRRRRCFTPLTLAQSYIFALMAKPEGGCSAVADTAGRLGVEVSTQAVAQRDPETLEKFFATLFPELVRITVASQESVVDIFKRFTQVIALDSSVISLPVGLAGKFLGGGVKNGHTIASLKLQTELDLKHGDLSGITIEPGRQTDQGTDVQHVEPPAGSLRITDLGYFNLEVFAMIARAGAYFLSRTQHTVSVTIEQKTMNLIKFLHQQGVGQVDCPVVLGTATKLRCRLIAWRVPDEVANRRRQKLKKDVTDKGRQVTAAGLAACDWEYLITNLPADKLSLQEAIIVYRARWQIELLFKRWKSFAQIDRLDGANETETMMRLWIRLCGAVVQHWVTTMIVYPAGAKLSAAKVAKKVHEMAHEITGYLRRPPKELLAFFGRFARIAKARCRRTKRKGRPGTFELLDDADLLEYTLS